jgi:hypothetical protein
MGRIAISILQHALSFVALGLPGVTLDEALAPAREPSLVVVSSAPAAGLSDDASSDPDDNPIEILANANIGPPAQNPSVWRSSLLPAVTSATIRPRPRSPPEDHGSSSPVFDFILTHKGVDP